MKIQTQAWLLVTGIVLAPLLIIITYIVYRQFFTIEDEFNLPTYGEVSELLNEDINERDFESVIRFALGARRLGEITIFSNDYLVLYSTNREFNPGVFVDRESVMFLLESENQTSRYNFTSQSHEEDRIYVLTKTVSIQPRPQFRAQPSQRITHFFIPAFTLFILIIVLTLFAIIMSIVITRNITRSVQVLENATRRIAGGELDLAVDVKGSNEITSLTNSLNKMRNALKEDELRRSRFIMGISHDLKTPLALIKGYAEAIEDGIAEDRASRAGAAEIIITKSDQLESMINDLIDYVRMDTGEWRAQLKHINLTTFLRNIIKTMSTDVELMHRALTHEINIPENLSVPMDERLVYRAVENLINNAIRYSYDESKIRLAAVTAENTVKLSISNDGPGIDKDDLPHIFEMLYRGSFSRREQGMGLGLAVVKWVADYHDWAISVLSNAGEETCFTITIPVV